VQFTKGLNHDQKQHHPICEFFEKWKAAHPTPVIPAVPLGQTDVGNLDIKTTSWPPVEVVLPKHTETAEVLSQVLKENEERAVSTDTSTEDCVLIDLDTKMILRDATLDEIAEAASEEQKSGAPTIVVDETMYAVVKRSEAVSGSLSTSL